MNFIEEVDDEPLDEEKLKNAVFLYHYIISQGRYASINASFDLCITEVHGDMLLYKTLEPTLEAVNRWLRGESDE